MHAEVAELRHIKLLRQAGLRLKQRHSVCRISKQTAVQFTVDLFLQTLSFSGCCLLADLRCFCEGVYERRNQSAYAWYELLHFRVYT
jgi:hypothetical protein